VCPILIASLACQRGHFYAQFYDSSRRPHRKNVPLKIKAAFLDDRSHPRPQTLRTYDAVLRRCVGFLGKGVPTERRRARHLENWLASTDPLADATKCGA